MPVSFLLPLQAQPPNLPAVHRPMFGARQGASPLVPNFCANRRICHRFQCSFEPCSCCKAALREKAIVQLQHWPIFSPRHEAEQGACLRTSGTSKAKRMAYVTRTADGLAGAGVASIVPASSGLLSRISEMLRRRKIYRTTVAELNSLSSRELADLGYSRSMITRLALEAAYGKK